MTSKPLTDRLAAEPLVDTNKMDQWLLVVTSGSVTKWSAKGLEVVGPGLVYCHFSFCISFLPCVVHNVVLRYVISTDSEMLDHMPLPSS